MDTQQYIQKMQDLYGEWQKLLPHLEKSIADWQRGAEIMKQLDAFYSSPEWLALYERADEFTIDSQGNYSVLSEDAVWNALTEQHSLRTELQQILDNTEHNPQQSEEPQQAV
ncbi:DUF4298 domain-containing protein [Neisseria sp. ZJ106]|uniref:DUF4298 domain-containing protein n=1 Tax=Neisseria lisongii TaxID=2912188 RepID=A0AAW5AHF2_9NEIS|nr:DUF4298 domain-containing protein [Neisseria lisongii]MCF7520843.1 DUF4298 domain-containing protein [Neisseria lisongii]MCF7529333.1 DUF4298 domain-containing protein [Neisseria lisongii]WCL70777.1 DUF4298 domain-containing protein [Neisseria lisongii]